MLLFSICLLCLFGVSLTLFAGLRQKPTSVQSAYGAPPADWPDVPVSALGLFQRVGKINSLKSPGNVRKAHRPERRGPARVTSFQDAQDILVGLVDPWTKSTPKIGLKLSADDGPDWTDVFFDGTIVARVPTKELASKTAA